MRSRMANNVSRWSRSKHLAWSMLKRARGGSVPHLAISAGETTSQALSCAEALMRAPRMPSGSQRSIQSEQALAYRRAHRRYRAQSIVRGRRSCDPTFAGEQGPGTQAKQEQSERRELRYTQQHHDQKHRPTGKSRKTVCHRTREKAVQSTGVRGLQRKSAHERRRSTSNRATDERRAGQQGRAAEPSEQPLHDLS